MENSKLIQFNGSAGGYFVLSLVSLILAYIPIVGAPLAFNYAASWLAKNSTVNGKQITYTASFGEAFKVIFIGVLLVIITFGIYVFWLYPKLIKFAADHIEYTSQATPTMPAQPVEIQPQPAMPTNSPQPPIVQ